MYLDAPHAATGPPPADVAPFFDPPYREWWRAEMVGSAANDGCKIFIVGEGFKLLLGSKSHVQDPTERMPISSSMTTVTDEEGSYPFSCFECLGPYILPLL